jgi:hypothetical protein
MVSKEFIQVKNAIYFSNSLVVEENENLKNLLQFITAFSKIYDEEKLYLPYHINLIDELHADENAHSRIFAQLLRFTQDNKYPFLEKFLNDVCEFKLTVKKPKIKKVDSCGRIDIPIFDEKYVVLIENKVTDKAPDQNSSNGGQIARYIDTIKKDYGRDLEEIFVVYTPKYTREPSDDCWINKDGVSYKSNFSQRFCSLSYREKIYPWLKEVILRSINEKDIYLRSAVEQYVDYLEGLFSLRTIDKKMNMKLQDFIKKELGLDDEKPEESVEALTEKETELNNAIAQIQQLKSKYKKQIILGHFEEWKKLLRFDFPSFKIVEDQFKKNKDSISVGVEFSIKEQRFEALIECNNCDTYSIYFGIGRPFANEKKYETPEVLQKILDANNLLFPDDFWYGWKWSTLENTYMGIKNLIEKIEKIESPNR